MNMEDIPFGTTDWESISRTEHLGTTGVAYWRTANFGSIRVRMLHHETIHSLLVFVNLKLGNARFTSPKNDVGSVSRPALSLG